MSALPILIGLLDEIDSVPDYDDFGYGIYPQHLQQRRRDVGRNASLLRAALPTALELYQQELMKRASAAAHAEKRAGRANTGPVSTVGKDGFQVCMDVAQFKPNELNVKVVDNSVVVEGKHEERQDDHGFISRHFVRRYTLPKDYDPNRVVSTLSSDGVLTISAPKPQPIEDKSKERVIQIQQTGPAHLNVKQNNQEDGEKTAEAIKNGGTATNAAGDGKK